MVGLKIISTCSVCIVRFIFALCSIVNANRCGKEGSVYGKTLQGSVFKTSVTETPYLCQQACGAETRCQSFNYNVYSQLCELNSRTKEARPHEFVADEERMYMTRYKNRGEQN